MRILVASTGGPGHLGPILTVADALAGQGHEIVFAVSPSSTERVTAAGHAVRVGAAPPQEETKAFGDRMSQLSADDAAVLMNRDYFAGLCAPAMLPAVRAAAEEIRPDLILREPCEYASAIVAAELGIRQAQTAISFAEVESWSLDLAEPALPAGTAEAIRAAAYLTRFPASLDPSPFPDTRRYRPDPPKPAAPLPTWWSDPTRPLLYVTLGTTTGQLPIAQAAYRATLDAVADLPVRVLLTAGQETDPADLGPIPANTHVESWVAQDDVFAVAEAVVCHGGSGTVFGALAAGRPLVLLPMFADQPVNAARVAAVGAGINPQPQPENIRAAIETVLDDAQYRIAAAKIADELRAAPEIGTLA
ncbi:MAG TPA: glycosyltransferase [Pseudonocardiaceae bacterium]|nr:glycosyltransferase [Pseudonocardiaceae bacterium]